MKKSEILKVLGESCYGYYVENVYNLKFLTVIVDSLNAQRIDFLKDIIMDIKPEKRGLKVKFYAYGVEID